MPESNIHHRRSIRLKGYDYSQGGLYFVTICVRNRQCLFGEIIDGEMMLNDAGKMVEKWCMELSRKFPDIALNTYVIMPNHFHAIIVNNGPSAAVGPMESVGADLCVCPMTYVPANRGEHTGSPLHAVVQWFKTMTTNEYIRGVKSSGWQPFDKKLWQRNYYERVIQNNGECQCVANYIINNPAQWECDEFKSNDNKK